MGHQFRDVAWLFANELILDSDEPTTINKLGVDARDVLQFLVENNLTSWLEGVEQRRRQFKLRHHQRQRQHHQRQHDVTIRGRRVKKVLHPSVFKEFKHLLANLTN